MTFDRSYLRMLLLEQPDLIPSAVLQELAGVPVFAPLLARDVTLPVKMWGGAWHSAASTDAMTLYLLDHKAPVPVPSLDHVDYMLLHGPKSWRANWLQRCVPCHVMHQYIQERATTKARKRAVVDGARMPVLAANPSLLVEVLSESEDPLVDGSKWTHLLMGNIDDEVVLSWATRSLERPQPGVTGLVALRDLVEVRRHLVPELLKRVPRALLALMGTSLWLDDYLDDLLPMLDVHERRFSLVMDLWSNPLMSDAAAAKLLRSGYDDLSMSGRPPRSLDHGVFINYEVARRAWPRLDWLHVQTLLRAANFINGDRSVPVPVEWERDPAGVVKLADGELDILLSRTPLYPSFIGTPLPEEITRAAGLLGRRDVSYPTRYEELFTYPVPKGHSLAVNETLTSVSELEPDAQVLAWRMLAEHPNDRSAWPDLIEVAKSLR